MEGVKTTEQIRDWWTKSIYQRPPSKLSVFQVFECFLLDHDWSLNAGNWLWLSASAFFHAYFRVYSPISFGKKTDPNGEYIRYI